MSAQRKGPLPARSEFFVFFVELAMLTFRCDFPFRKF